MEVKLVKIVDIRPYDRNPRNNDGAVDAVAASIKEFGWQQPIVVDRDGVIIAGHTRYKAAQKLKCKEVPVVVAENLTDEQVKAYRLADNKTGELVGWDFSALEEELAVRRKKMRLITTEKQFAKRAKRLLFLQEVISCPAASTPIASQI